MDPEITLNPILPLGLSLRPEVAAVLVEQGHTPQKIDQAWQALQTVLQTGAFFAAIGFNANEHNSMAHPVA